ncbi:MAG: HDOD domain-containing protein, partial [Proteobacteria bacterium]|nr:HDOD domain-containing protein [Pseudomonadota bacterium]
LEIVNSAMYGLKSKITVLSEAVVFLGLDEIKKLSIGMTVFEKIFKTGKNRRFDRLLFWRHSLCVAVLSMEIAREIGYPNPEEAYISGLLHDVGKIFMDIQGKTDYGEFIDGLSKSSDLVIERERSVIGLGHDDIGAFFASLWKLPEKLVLAIKYHHQPFEHVGLDPQETMLVSIVSLANFLCWTQGMGSFDFIRPPILPPEVEKTIPAERINIIKCLQNMNQEVENISQFYQFVFPSASELRENLLWANLKLSKANTRYYYHEEPRLEKTSPESDDNLPFDVTLELGKPLARAKNIKEVLDIVMYQVGCIFQPLHWSIILKNAKTSDMVFSVVVGENKEKLQGAILPKGEGIAGYIMETGESVIIEDVTKDKRFSNRVDKYSGFTTQSIIGTPLKTEDKVFGVIELINRINNDCFSSQDLKILSSIAEYAAIAIERSYYNQALATLATKDTLTGLKNKWSFDKAVSNKDDVLKRFGTVFSMLIIEVDQYTKVLEDNGNGACDEIIKDLADVLSRTKRHKDEIFRYGEDTFIILLPLTYSDGAKEARHRILKAYAIEATQQNKTPARITITAHTINPGEITQMKQMVKTRLAKSTSQEEDEDTAGEIQDHLQPLVAEQYKTKAEPIEDKTVVGKTVSLGGEFVRLKTRESGHMQIEKLSLSFIGFRISKSHRIQVNDFLDIQFPLNDINKSLIQRRVVVREIKGNYIFADFYNPPPYAKQLGFFLMS